MPRVLVLGPRPLLEACAPSSVAGVLEVLNSPEEPALTPAQLEQVDAAVAFEPGSDALESLARLELPAIVWSAQASSSVALTDRRRLVLTHGDHPLAWRSISLPVADHLFSASSESRPSRAAFLGPPSPRRERYLELFEHARTPSGEDDEKALVAVNLHDLDEPGFEQRAVCALAASRLLVSETLTPARGLEPGIDYLEARELDDVFLGVESALSDPGAYRRMRLRGRRKAELFRASRVVGRLVHDLLLEMKA